MTDKVTLVAFHRIILLDYGWIIKYSQLHGSNLLHYSRLQ